MIAAVLVGCAVTAAAGQQDIPTVAVAPAEAEDGGPNDGRWFAEELVPGSSTRSAAKLTNPADVDQEVRLSVQDVVFSDRGVPSFSEQPVVDGVASWVRLEQLRATVPARGSITVGFAVDVPTSAEPGDHVGALVVSSAPTQGQFEVTKQVATRLYVTVPGVATKDAELAKIDRKVVGGLFPSRLDVTVALRNTGRIRLQPDVRVNGAPAAGSAVLLTESVELYRAQVDVPWFGGRVAVDVQAQTGAKPLEDESSVLVVPWALIAICLLLLLAASLLLVLFLARRRRKARERQALEEELLRLRQQVSRPS